ncbi:MAG: type II toxin-antitoxin system PemK/MazF family toxin [Clostridiales bacterium]
MNYLRRGDVYDVVLNPVKGAEKSKVRPAVIVQNDIANQYSPLTTIVPITDAKHIKKLMPVMVLIPAGEGGLTKDSCVDCGQIRTVDIQARLSKKRGTLGTATMEAVDKALKISLGLR